MDRARPRLFTYGPAGCSDKPHPRQKRKNAKAPSGLLEDLVGKPPWPRVMHSSRASIDSSSVEYSITGSATTTYCMRAFLPSSIHHVTCLS